MGWSKDPGPPSGGEFPRHFHTQNYYKRIIVCQKKYLAYSYIKVKKSECPDVITMTSQVSKALADVLRSNESFWNSFDKVIIYYDNGQIELTKILTSVFSTVYTHVEC